MGNLPVHSRCGQRPQEDLGGPLGTAQRAGAVQSRPNHVNSFSYASIGVSQRFLFSAFQSCIRHRLALGDAEILDVLEHQGRNLGSLGQLDVNELYATYIIEYETGPHVRLHGSNLDIPHLDSLHMTDVEAVGWQRSKAVRIRIDVLQFRCLDCGVFLCASALVQYQNVTELDVFDVVTRNSTDERG